MFDGTGTAAEVVTMTIVDLEGIAHSIQARSGETVMQVATTNGISGIDADCGGCCACGTCRVHVPIDLADQLPPSNDDEDSVLSFSGEPDKQYRLGCQIVIDSKFNDTVISVATG